MNESKKAVISVSGGLDSVTLLHFVVKELDYEVFPIAFYYGQKHNLELKMAKLQIEEVQGQGYNVHNLKIVDISFMKDLLGDSNALTSNNVEVPTLEEVVGQPQPITYVCNRNMMFLSIALSYAEACKCNKVFYGAQAHDEYSGYWDCSLYFVERINKVSELNRLNNIKVIAPFVSLHKSEEIVLGIALNINYAKSWTSYKVIDEQYEIADYENPTSRDRIKAFAEVGMIDPIKYNRDIDWDALFKNYKKEFNYTVIVNKVLQNITDQE